ncbi:MAG: hypothetical protein ACRDM1_12185 [Gaiellaceae bacterium]
MPSSLAAVPDLEHELDGLYDLPLEEFTKARNDLAGRLKRAHQVEAAAAVRALKKPSLVAWGANRLARDEPAQVAALLTAGGRLRDAQQRLLAGKGTPEEVGDATAAEREALRALLASGRKLLGARTSASLLDRLGQTLRAAAVDDQAGPLLERGRLTEELTAVGFGPLEAVKPARRRGDELGRAARERVTALRAEARTLAAEARTAAEAADQAGRAAQMLAEEAAQKRREAERAASELVEAEESLRARR